MRIEDLKNWTVDQLKKEVVRLSEECEEKQHKILDLQEYRIAMKRNFAKMVEEKCAKDGTIDLPFCDSPEEIVKCKNQHQSDCITINQL